MRTKEVVPTVRALKLREAGGLPGNGRELRGMLGGSFLMGKLSPKEPNPISLKHLVARNGFASSYCGQNVMTKAHS